MPISKIRRPNFKRAKAPPPTHSADAPDADNVTRRICRGRSAAPPPSGRLAGYTRQCHKTLLMSRDDASFRADDDDDDGVPSVLRSDGGNNSGGGLGDSNFATDRDAKKKNDPSMEQCIALLEPSLTAFQSACVRSEKARAKKSKKRPRDGRKRSNDDGDGDGNQDAKCNDATNAEEGDDDEVPPQLLRLARFFHFRWLPIKRALLRPPPSPSGRNSTNACDVEMGVIYRLRLAEACRKKGLVAAAEYESLKGALSGGKRMREDDDATKGDDDCGSEFGKRRETDKLLSEGGDRSSSLTERVRLSLMRLPADAVQPERSGAAWGHVEEMISECCRRWGTENDDDPQQQRRGSTHLTTNDTASESSLAPARVAEWTMTCWTALLLSRGMECFSPSAAGRRRGGSIASVERRLAALLTDRSPSGNLALPIARAAASRIDELLRPRNLRHLNVAHLYSLGKLFASFHSREDAEMHIVISICKCSMAGGMMGLEQLARLLAVYSCCISAATSVDVDDAFASNNTNKRTTVKDMELRLYAKLGNNDIVKRIVLEDDENAHTKRPNKNGEMSVRTRSFFEAVLHATAHLVKSNKDNGHSRIHK